MRIFHLAIAVALLAALSTTACRAQQDFSDELPRIPPTEPEAALKTFQVADGFHLEPVAAEPLVTSPVAVEWDADGRMYVCEMRGYSEDRDAGISRITRLEDVDHDGTYDRSVVFVDELLWPTALFPFDGGLFVADAPNIYYFKDTDGDGVADVRHIALTGFNIHNVQGLLNSFHWGLDNRIHVACGTVGGKVHRGQDDPSTAVEVRGRDIAFDPRTYEFERTSGGAQHGMCFDDWGRKFASSNSDHIQQVMYEDRYIARNPQLKAPNSRLSIAVDGPQAEVFRTSPVEPWRIVRTRLRVSGQVRGPVEGGGRAAGYFTGATGITIYRGDAWPQQWKGTAIVGDVGSNLVHRKRLEPNGVAFKAHRIDEKSEFVTSNDIWFRPAQFANAPDGTLHIIDVCREVIEHPASLPPDIKKHLDLTAGRDRGRIYRLAPDGYRFRPAPSLSTAPTQTLVTLLQHANAWHRETAARLLYERQDRSAIAAIEALAGNASLPQGRLHAMYALAGMDALDEDVLLARLRDEHPQVRRHAIRLTEPLLDSPALQAAVLQHVDDESLDVRYQLAFTLGYLPAEKRIAPLARLLQADRDDSWMRMAVLSSIGDDTDQLFVTLAEQTGADAAFVLPLIGDQIADKAKTDAAVRDALSSLLTDLQRVAGDEQQPPAARRQAISGLQFGDFEALEATFAELLDGRQPLSVQRQALTTLGRFADQQVATMVLEVWPGLSPQLRQVATEILFSRPAFTAALFDALDDQQIAVSEIAPTRLKLAAESGNESIRARAASYLSHRGGKGESRQAVIDAYRKSLNMAADAARGRAVFRKQCAGCHAAEGVGHETGPKLATLQSRGAETILVNLLDPNREVNPQYLNYVVLTVDGRTLTGMITAESATSVTLRRADAATDTVLREDIEQIRSTGVSLMPEGLEENMDPQAVADLLRYLMELK
ncbi:PVC-type heme-binding CxxCH protein [Roseimaritima ulvae]|uniref:Cytochrome c n=1 Tax=Roseimaritima ulvae TaxID=980254 RepID=A0A5B9QLZ0_9BACT|nr:PVC-type heme-binding CxxCH protein [Roseimaritima ulvae]QEG39964.1 Cytochrome c [Roseimaritima ulvae]